MCLPAIAHTAQHSLDPSDVLPTLVPHTGGSHPDDCNGGPPEGWTTWDATPTGHDGFIMLGGPLDSEILYPGCQHGINYGTATNVISETAVEPTNILKVAVCQSISNEVVSVDLSLLEFMALLEPPSAPLPPSPP